MLTTFVINVSKLLINFKFVFLLTTSTAKPIIHLMPYEFINQTKINKELIHIDNLYQTYKHQVREQETVRLLCEIVKSNPPLNGDVRWFINDIELESFKKIYPNGK